MIAKLEYQQIDLSFQIELLLLVLWERVAANTTEIQQKHKNKHKNKHNTSQYKYNNKHKHKQKHYCDHENTISCQFIPGNVLECTKNVLKCTNNVLTMY